MKVIIIERKDGTVEKSLQFENPEDFNKFAQDLGKLERDLNMWPGRALEMPVQYLTVNITKNMPTSVEKTEYIGGIPTTVEPEAPNTSTTVV